MCGLCVCVHVSEGQLDPVRLLGLVDGARLAGKCLLLLRSLPGQPALPQRQHHIEGESCPASPPPRVPSDTTWDPTATLAQDLLPQLWTHRHRDSSLPSHGLL